MDPADVRTAQYDGGECVLNQLGVGDRRERTDAVYVGFANLLMATLDTDPDQVARPGTVDEANFKIG